MVTTNIVTQKDYRLKDKYKKKIGYTPKQVKTCKGFETKTKKKEITKCKETNKKDVTKHK